MDLDYLVPYCGIGGRILGCQCGSCRCPGWRLSLPLRAVFVRVQLSYCKSSWLTLWFDYRGYIECTGSLDTISMDVQLPRSLPGYIPLCIGTNIHFINTPFIAGSWFGATERATATALGVMANQFGTTLGLGITILVRFTTTMSGGSTGNNNDHMSNDNSSNVNHHVQLLDPIPLHHYLAVQMYISVFALVLVLVWGGDRPPTPPSAAAEGARAADAKKPTATTTAAAAATILTTYPSQHQTNQCDIVVNGTTLTSVDKFDCKETHCSYQSEYIALSGEGTQDIPDSLHKSHHPNYTDISPNYFESICLVFLSSSNVIFVAAFGTAVGVFYTIDTFISQLTPVWWPPEWNGWLGVIFQLTGLLGSFLSGRWMDTTSNQKHVCLCLLLLSAVSLATLVLSLCLLGAITTEDQHENTVQSWIGITGLLVGAFGAGLGLAGWNAAGLELGTGIAYPAEEAAVAGILESSAELFGFLWVTIGSAMLVEHRPLPFVMVLVVAVCASALMVQGLQAKTQRPL